MAGHFRAATFTNKPFELDVERAHGFIRKHLDHFVPLFRPLEWNAASQTYQYPTWAEVAPSLNAHSRNKAERALLDTTTGIVGGLNFSLVHSVGLAVFNRRGAEVPGMAAHHFWSLAGHRNNVQTPRIGAIHVSNKHPELDARAIPWIRDQHQHHGTTLLVDDMSDSGSTFSRMQEIFQTAFPGDPTPCLSIYDARPPWRVTPGGRYDIHAGLRERKPLNLYKEVPEDMNRLAAVHHLQVDHFPSEGDLMVAAGTPRLRTLLSLQKANTELSAAARELAHLTTASVTFHGLPAPRTLTRSDTHITVRGGMSAGAGLAGMR
jgi:hypothetical protein